MAHFYAEYAKQWDLQRKSALCENGVSHVCTCRTETNFSRKIGSSVEELFLCKRISFYAGVPDRGNIGNNNSFRRHAPPSFYRICGKTPFMSKFLLSNCLCCARYGTWDGNGVWQHLECNDGRADTQQSERLMCAEIICENGVEI